nr:hypothetical protein CFP56_09563 [Quercus suber]
MPSELCFEEVMSSIDGKASGPFCWISPFSLSLSSFEFSISLKPCRQVAGIGVLAIVCCSVGCEAANSYANQFVEEYGGYYCSKIVQKDRPGSDSTDMPFALVKAKRHHRHYSGELAKVKQLQETHRWRRVGVAGSGIEGLLKSWSKVVEAQGIFSSEIHKFCNASMSCSREPGGNHRETDRCSYGLPGTATDLPELPCLGNYDLVKDRCRDEGRRAKDGGVLQRGGRRASRKGHRSQAHLDGFT